MLTTLNELKTFLGVAYATTTEDAVLSQILLGADAAIKRYCRRDFEEKTYTEFYSGTGKVDLVLKQFPVSSVTTVHVDPTGYAGQGPSAFAASTLLTAGQDYYLTKDDAGSSGSGVLRRVGIQLFGALWGFSYNRGRTLSGIDRGPVWEMGDGNIKVVYVAGYAERSVPEDLRIAVWKLCAQVRAERDSGRAKASENYIDYAYSLLQSNRLDFGEIRALLSSHRDISMGSVL